MSRCTFSSVMRNIAVRPDHRRDETVDVLNHEADLVISHEHALKQRAWTRGRASLNAFQGPSWDGNQAINGGSAEQAARTTSMAAAQRTIRFESAPGW